jgi:Fe-S-cluster-containing dehydrogenase component
MDRVRDGEEPFCVKTCHQRARVFGDLDDKHGAIAKLVNSTRTERLFEDIGTEPQVYYIMSKGGQG